MGVTILQPYPLPEGKSGAHIIDQLSKRLLALGATHAGQFLVDCETFISTPQPHNGAPGRAVHVLHNSEYPASTFSIIDNGTGKQVAIVADNIFDLLMLKMTNTFTSKKQTKIESRGARFEYGDFVIKLGSVTMMDHFKGILIEIEYKSCVILAYCWEMIREMLQGFLGIAVNKDFPSYFAPQTIMTAMGQQQLHAKHNDIFEPMDTVKQYLEQFTNYRKHVTLMGGMGSAPGGQQVGPNVHMSPAVGGLHRP
ncbi:mediator of RNA polymerase II transcription subunit 20 [Drosophila sechellia]|uniref:Mediator of RNA polymerase II transcription subunit 20 n=1 Tax=Drosophila sechellia TaxID=7238 RepID=B4HYE2_DROSE|nr:mediator of RNA polymerase II transcription subunit 20 [Drosophila sechellia]EDW52072.1 GM13189 [Drosophila sechellia]